MFFLFILFVCLQLYRNAPFLSGWQREDCMRDVVRIGRHRREKIGCITKAVQDLEIKGKGDAVTSHIENQ